MVTLIAVLFGMGAASQHVHILDHVGASAVATPDSRGPAVPADNGAGATDLCLLCSVFACAIALLVSLALSEPPRTWRGHHTERAERRDSFYAYPKGRAPPASSLA